MLVIPPVFALPRPGIVTTACSPKRSNFGTPGLTQRSLLVAHAERAAAVSVLMLSDVSHNAAQSRPVLEVNNAHGCRGGAVRPVTGIPGSAPHDGILKQLWIPLVAA